MTRFLALLADARRWRLVMVLVFVIGAGWTLLSQAPAAGGAAPNAADQSSGRLSRPRLHAQLAGRRTGDAEWAAGQEGDRQPVGILVRTLHGLRCPLSTGFIGTTGPAASKFWP